MVFFGVRREEGPEADQPLSPSVHTVKDVRELTTPSEATSIRVWDLNACCDLGFPPSPAFSRTDDGARDAARTAALYATTTLSPCE